MLRRDPELRADAQVRRRVRRPDLPTDAGGLSGTSRANYEYSDCVGTSNYQAENAGTGTHVTRGFVS
ncbi:hypothetical protein [Streptomyces sp. KL116D]|uniref:hypothetical protein n=1 Tax=Streptomyces sp. KL116D TaxID=3045152 RepID=UPI0035587E44